MFMSTSFGERPADRLSEMLDAGRFAYDLPLDAVTQVFSGGDWSVEFFTPTAQPNDYPVLVVYDDFDMLEAVLSALSQAARDNAKAEARNVQGRVAA